MKRILDKIGGFKIPLLMLALGVLLMLLPGTPRREQTDRTPDLAEALTLAEGVGEACVLLSENGAVIVCDGADDAVVRWKITEAVRTYTGFGADQITILKKADQ